MITDLKYWNGSKNKFIRYYFYVQRGLMLINEMRYLIMAILAIYAILKFSNFWLMPLMFFISLPVLGVLGYISVHHMSKVTDYLAVHFGTHFSKYSVELQEKTLLEIEKLVRINEQK
jgi:hypothetical protein